MQAFATVKDYIDESSLDPKAVTGGDVGAVRNLLDPGQLDQFEASVTRPTGDGSHEATGWLVRFDPAEHLQLVGGDAGVRVDGQVSAGQVRDSALEVTADHTFVYALRGPGKPDMPVSLFTVRRHLLFRFSHQDLQQRHIQVVQAQVAAGPLSCGNGVEGYFRPILAGGRASAGAGGVNPFAQDSPVGPKCAPLSTADTPSAGTPSTAAAGSASLSPQGPARATALMPPPQAPGSRSHL